MNKRHMLALLVAIMLCTMTGCSLAVEGAGAESSMGSGRLIGVFVTREYINMHEIGEVITDIEDSGKVYATVKKNNSENPSDWEVDFEGIEGYAFFHPTYHMPDGSFSMISGADKVCDVNQHLNVSDEGESVRLSGTIYALIEKEKEHVLYANPVYQTEDGEIYLTQGNGVHMSSLGPLMKITLEEEITLEEAGKTKSYTGAVELSYEVLNAVPTSIRFHFMNEKLEILHTESYVAGAVPSEVNAEEDAVCVVVETEWEDGTVSRELVEKERDERVCVKTFYQVDDIVIAKMETQIIWK